MFFSRSFTSRFKSAAGRPGDPRRLSPLPDSAPQRSAARIDRPSKPGVSSTTADNAAMACGEQAHWRVGRDAEGWFRLALWCESLGLRAERANHLALATLIEPHHAPARVLTGRVWVPGRWKSPEEHQRDGWSLSAIPTPLWRLRSTSWRTGKGWTMARDLRPGARLRELGGTTRLVSATDAQPTMGSNREVALIESQRFRRPARLSGQ